MISTRTTLYSLLIALSIAGMLLVSIVAFRYSYNALSTIESVVGFLVLGAVAGSLWLYRKRISQPAHSFGRNSLQLLGMAFGLLWMVEISINNLLAPPLPARDIIDNAFWAVIAASILVSSIFHAYKNNSLKRGIEVGIWSGFISGLLACCMGLSLIVFGMPFILRDPLNIAVWAGRAAGSHCSKHGGLFRFRDFSWSIWSSSYSRSCHGRPVGIDRRKRWKRSQTNRLVQARKLMIAGDHVQLPGQTLAPLKKDHGWATAAPLFVRAPLSG